MSSNSLKAPTMSAAGIRFKLNLTIDGQTIDFSTNDQDVLKILLIHSIDAHFCRNIDILALPWFH